jgi:flavodoxin short chain
MKKALIIYGSTTGNTETMADIVQKGLDGAGLTTELKNVTDVEASELNGPCDIVLLGCPAYGDDEIELQEDFVDFAEDMEGMRLNGKLYAVFAPGDSDYEYFCGSVDYLEELIEKIGGKLAAAGLKIDGDPGDSADEIMDWAKSAAEAVN